MNLTEFSLKRPVTTLMIFTSFVVLGIIAFNLIPMEFFPAFDYPALTVFVPYGGSTPEETERQITRPVEEALAMISGVTEMGSYSGEWGCRVWLEFDWGADVDGKALEAREKVDAIRHLLPDDVERFFVHKWNSEDEPILRLRLSTDKDLSDAYDMLDRNIKRRLERIAGVAKIEMYGVQKKQVEIQIILDKLTAYNLDLKSVLQNLRNSNFALSAGKILEGGKQYSIRTIERFNSIDEIQNLLVDGNNIRLKDIANITYEMPESNFGRHLDRKYAIGLEVFKASGMNTVELSKRIIREIEEIERNPEMKGISIFLMDNQAEGILSSLNELKKSGIIGAILATLILYFFLRKISHTLIVVLSVPLSLLVTATWMYFAGISLNILSMMGLMLAVGMLVDNSVVSMESIYRYQILEKDRKKAVNKGVSKISLAIIAGTMTTIIVFLPNLVGEKNEVTVNIKHVGVPLILALFASLIIAQTIVPLLTIMRKKEASIKPKNKQVDWLVARYEKVLSWVLKRHKTSIIITLIIIASVAIPGKFVKKDMFPNQAERRFRIFYHINGSYKKEEVEKVVDQVEEYLYDNQEKFEIESVYSWYSENYAGSIIMLTKGKEAHRKPEEIMEDIKKGMPKFAIASPSYEWNRQKSQVQESRVYLQGKSSERLMELSKELAKVLERMEGIEEAKSDAEAGSDEIRVMVDREKAKRHGFSSMEVARMISTSMRGTNIHNFRNEYGEVDVLLRFQDEDKQNLESLKEISLLSNDKKMVKLATIANFEKGKGAQGIFRRNRATSMGISIKLDDMTVEDAREKIRGIMRNFHLPTGYQWTLGRKFDHEREAQDIMKFNTIMALALIYFVMAAIFESFLFPAAIWLSIGFSIIGVFWFFLMTGTTFSIMAWMGILILIGVVVNNGIVLIDHINQLRSGGMARQGAILKAGQERLRPILMTAGTTVLSLIPLCIAKTQIGGNGPPYYPMARAIAGGLTFSTVVTLLILPTIYIILDDLSAWGKRIVSMAVDEE